jgi:fructokinase
MNSPKGHAVVCYGEVLWDILPSGEMAGGAPMNVAFHLKKLGTNPALITKTGSDEYGRRLKELLATAGITTSYFTSDSTFPTGLVYANANDQNEVVYDIVHPAAWDFISWSEELSNLVSRSSFFVFGSLASRSRASADTLARLLAVANTKVCDINLRAPHFKPADVEFLLSKADILKMNVNELELVTSWYERFQSPERSIHLLHEKFDIDTIIITKGADGSMVSHAGNTWQHSGYPVSVADTIGSGDSFLAGFLHNMLNGAPVNESLEFATALGALIATKTGACPDYDISEIFTLINPVHQDLPTI